MDLEVGLAGAPVVAGAVAGVVSELAVASDEINNSRDHDLNYYT